VDTVHYTDLLNCSSVIFINHWEVSVIFGEGILVYLTYCSCNSNTVSKVKSAGIKLKS